MFDYVCGKRLCAQLANELQANNFIEWSAPTYYPYTRHAFC
jgi:hypothetical protein